MIGKITTGSNKVILQANATTSGAGNGKYINGNAQRAFTAASPSFNFPIGNSTLQFYDPIALTFTGITTGGDIIASVTGADCSRNSKF